MPATPAAAPSVGEDDEEPPCQPVDYADDPSTTRSHPPAQPRPSPPNTVYFIPEDERRVQQIQARDHGLTSERERQCELGVSSAAGPPSPLRHRRHREPRPSPPDTTVDFNLQYRRRLYEVEAVEQAVRAHLQRQRHPAVPITTTPTVAPAPGPASHPPGSTSTATSVVPEYLQDDAHQSPAAPSTPPLLPPQLHTPALSHSSSSASGSHFFVPPAGTPTHNTRIELVMMWFKPLLSMPWLLSSPPSTWYITPSARDSRRLIPGLAFMPATPGAARSVDDDDEEPPSQLVSSAGGPESTGSCPATLRARPDQTRDCPSDTETAAVPPPPVRQRPLREVRAPRPNNVYFDEEDERRLEENRAREEAVKAERKRKRELRARARAAAELAVAANDAPAANQTTAAAETCSSAPAAPQPVPAIQPTSQPMPSPTHDAALAGSNLPRDAASGPHVATASHPTARGRPPGRPKKQARGAARKRPRTLPSERASSAHPAQPAPLPVAELDPTAASQVCRVAGPNSVDPALSAASVSRSGPVFDASWTGPSSAPPVSNQSLAPAPPPPPPIIPPVRSEAAARAAAAADARLRLAAAAPPPQAVRTVDTLDPPRPPPARATHSGVQRVAIPDDESHSSRSRTATPRPEPPAPDTASPPVEKIIVFLTAAGYLPASFVRTEMFIATYPPRLGVPHVRRLLKIARVLPDPFSAARDLLCRAFASCPSVSVYSSDTLPPSVLRPTASLTTLDLAPPDVYRYHGKLADLLSTTECPLPVLCSNPPDRLDAYRARLTSPSQPFVPAVHLFLTHFMLRDPTLPPTTPDAAQAPTSAPTPRGLAPANPPVAPRIPASNARPSTSVSVASTSAAAGTRDDPMDVDLLPDVPARALPPASRPARAASVTPSNDDDALAERLIRQRYADAVEDIAYCSELMHPNRRTALLALFADGAIDLPIVYGTAFASYRIWGQVKRVCRYLSLAIHKPSQCRRVRLGTARTFSVNPKLVCSALGVPLGTWSNLKTRFAQLDDVDVKLADAIDAPNVDPDRLVALEELRDRLSFFLGDVTSDQPRENPDAYADEFAVVEWKTADFEEAIDPWRT
ncbi:hypothetical protein AURDEDRAFT_123373 [Auricularia subglabra TFB-10046 SS5]|nr:hypothetical protein AURDEDRAFT_123373 [Auricularia subglabra TFB-10046 SS5]